MERTGIFNSIKKNHAPYTVSATNLSFHVPGASFSYEFQTRNWIELLADGSFRIVAADYVRQTIDLAIAKVQSVQ